MSEKLEKLKTIVEPVTNLGASLPKISLDRLTSYAINAADAATSPIRSCGGSCVECRSIGRIIGQAELRVCDILEQNEITVYRLPDKDAVPRTSVGGGAGVFY